MVGHWGGTLGWDPRVGFWDRSLGWDLEMIVEVVLLIEVVRW